MAPHDTGSRQDEKERRMHTPDVSELIASFVRDGWLADPAQVGLRSFSAIDLARVNADVSGDLAEHHVFSFVMNLSSTSRVIGAEIKTYFHAEDFQTNGLRLLNKVRLTTLLKYLRRQNNGAVLPSAIFFSTDFSEGGVLFHNGVLIQFISENHRANYYVNTVESAVDASGEDRGKFANERYVSSMFRRYNFSNGGARELAANGALRKLRTEWQKMAAQLVHI